jgi:hypothetical protein
VAKSLNQCASACILDPMNNTNSMTREELEARIAECRALSRKLSRKQALAQAAFVKAEKLLAKTLRGELTSEYVKRLFASQGVRVRVRDQRNKFRICPMRGADFPTELVAAIANSIDLTNACGEPIRWSSFNGSRELFAYKPGAIVRI